MIDKKNCIIGPEKAQGIVEFALSLPILLILIFGVIEAGRLLFIYSAVTTSSREAVRYGSAIGNVGTELVNYTDCSGIRSAGSRLGFLAGIRESDILIDYDHGPGTETFATCTSTFVIHDPVAVRRVTQGDRIVVSVSTMYSPIVPLVNFPPFKIESISARTILKDVPIQANSSP